nr:glutamate synthase subunit alpha [Candidatus Omnitrophota bacterium]
NFVANELREIMSLLGIRKLEDMVGRVDLLEPNKEILPWKAKDMDFSRILYKPFVHKDVIIHSAVKQDHGIDKILDLKLIELAKPAIEKGIPVKINLNLKNNNRTTGAMLSGEICRIYGERGLAEETIHCKFKGVAGQSFGAFLVSGVTFELEGMANDYVGKGISGGKVIIYPDKASDYKTEDNILIGNTAFYGAINGEAYICGIAGERFCIRNSGLDAVVEGVGDHGCEYMTGGRVVILGRTGRNFGAGMSGGIAYCFDAEGDFHKRCNMDMVALEGLNDADASTIKNLLANHYKYTLSSRARDILDNFEKYVKSFIKVMPLEYKRIIEEGKPKKGITAGEYTDG